MVDHLASLIRYAPHILGAMILVWACLAPTGLIGVDETIYFAGADALRRTGSFVVENGASEFDYDGLRLAVMVFGPDGLVPQYPVGSALVGAPMMALFGIRGMIIVNALAAVATLFVARGLAQHLFRDERVANLTPVMLAAATFFLEFAFAIWPHSVSILCVSLGLLLALRAMDDEREHQVRDALLAGLVLGIGMLFRLDTLLLVPGVSAVALFFARQPVRIMVMIAIGMVPALAISSFANQQKFGTWNPITYGKDGGFTALTTHLGPAIFVIFGATALLAWRATGFRRPSVEIQVSIGAIALVVAMIAQPTRELILRYVNGFWGLIVDARSISDERAGVAPLHDDVLLFWGHAKQALGQSAPWLGAIFLLLHRDFRNGVSQSLWTIGLIGVLWSFPLFLLSWHGGSGNSMRYLAPMLPLLAALGSWLIIKLWERIRRPLLTIGWGVVIGSIALFAFLLLHPAGSLGARQGITTIMLAAVSVICVAAAMLPRWQDQLRQVAMLTIGAGLIGAYFSTLTSIGQDQSERWINASYAEKIADLPDKSVVIGGVGLMRDFAFRPGHILVLLSEDPEVDDRAFLDEAFANGYRVYTFPWITAGNNELAGYSLKETGYRWSDGVMLEVEPMSRAGGPTNTN